jgi:hypothetical protein
MTGNDNNPIAAGEHVTASLSEYIDGTLSVAERDTVRAHLEGCDTCRADHAELVATRAILRAVPAMQAPRSFTLTPEMAREARPPSLFNRIFTPGNAPRMATGSVLAFLLLFFVLVFGGFLNRTMLSPAPTTFSKIGAGLNSGESMPAPEARQQDQSVTMSAPAEPTATTGAAVAVITPNTEGFTAQATPPPPIGQDTTRLDTDATTAAGAPAPTSEPGAEAGTTAAEAQPTQVALAPAPPQAFSRQAAPSGPPVDWGAAIMSALPLFLLALGLVLAVMAWIARRNNPV